MREIRQSGSEGGGIEINRFSLPLCAPEGASSQRGASPLQANALQPVTECNCDAAMRGGEQQEVKRPVRRMTNSIRPDADDEPASER